tara:strand:- start:267 stop:1070 length:804 start_codon:yes stop_codon:yes gene_type:complete
MKNLFLTLMLCGSVFAANTLSVSSITDDGAGNVTFSIDYMFEDEVGGFQLDLLTDGVVTVTGTAGGDASAAWAVSTNSSGTILGFSFSGTTMTAGSGHFLDVTGTYDPAHAGMNVGVSALEDCATNGAPSCNDDGDTRMVLSSPAGTSLTSSFATGCWTVGSSDMCSELNTDHSAYSFGLSKNYPNPFNPTTTIGYDVAVAGDVSIVIYDMMGREVKNLVSDYANPGSYSVVWNAKNNQGLEVSAGMYVYKMIAGDFVQVNKMLLVK